MIIAGRFIGGPDAEPIKGYPGGYVPLTTVQLSNTATNSNGMVSTSAVVPGTPATSAYVDPETVPLIGGTSSTSYSWLWWVGLALVAWWLLSK